MQRLQNTDRGKKVWCSQIAGLVKQRSLLVLDSFEVQKTEQVKHSFKHENTHVVVILGGLTSVLQPLGVCLNKPLEDRVCQKWTTWMAEGPDEVPATRRQKNLLRR